MTTFIDSAASGGVVLALKLAGKIMVVRRETTAIVNLVPTVTSTRDVPIRGRRAGYSPLDVVTQAVEAADFKVLCIVRDTADSDFVMNAASGDKLFLGSDVTIATEYLILAAKPIEGVDDVVLWELHLREGK